MRLHSIRKHHHHPVDQNDLKLNHIEHRLIVTLNRTVNHHRTIVRLTFWCKILYYYLYFSVSPYPSTSTSPFDASIYYAPLPSTNPPCSSTTSFLSDTTPYYSNSYYPPSSSYYFPYGASSPLPPPSQPPTSSPIGHYSFMTPFNYPLNNSPNVDTKSFLCMQPSTSMPSVDENRFNLLIPTSADTEQY